MHLAAWCALTVHGYSNENQESGGTGGEFNSSLKKYEGRGLSDIIVKLKHILCHLVAVLLTFQTLLTHTYTAGDKTCGKDSLANPQLEVWLLSKKQQTQL